MQILTASSIGTGNAEQVGWLPNANAVLSAAVNTLALALLFVINVMVN